MASYRHILLFFFHGVTARSGPEPPSFWDFIPKVSWSVSVHSVVSDRLTAHRHILQQGKCFRLSLVVAAYVTVSGIFHSEDNKNIGKSCLLFAVRTAEGISLVALTSLGITTGLLLSVRLCYSVKQMRFKLQRWAKRVPSTFAMRPAI